jgi:2-polyprenyl-6-hydroxyphenyl methylase/3-demethylubiquinone-9 3-methyltransferase
MTAARSRQSRPTASSTVDAAEVARFDALAATWWDENGPMRPLHAMNPARLGFIRTQALAHFQPAHGALPLAGLKVADVGCGGGLLSEPLARMGGAVTGVDPAERNIAVASAHAEAMGLSIRYRATTIEALAAEGERFDLITALEVIEHVSDPAAFLAALFEATRPGGLVVLSTLNRSKRAFAAAIVGAEYLLRWLPVGTHDWNKFIRPEELEGLLEDAGFRPLELKGMVPDLFGSGFRLSDDTAVNYILAAARPA